MSVKEYINGDLRRLKCQPYTTIIIGLYAKQNIQQTQMLNHMRNIQEINFMAIVQFIVILLQLMRNLIVPVVIENKDTNKEM